MVRSADGQECSLKKSSTSKADSSPRRAFVEDETTREIKAPLIFCSISAQLSFINSKARRGACVFPPTELKTKKVSWVRTSSEFKLRRSVLSNKSLSSDNPRARRALRRSP